MAGWMNTPLGTEVDLGAGHIVLDVVPAVRERGTATPSFSHIYCGHGRPSQVLLSSCLKPNSTALLRFLRVLVDLSVSSAADKLHVNVVKFWKT